MREGGFSFALPAKYADPSSNFLKKNKCITAVHSIHTLTAGLRKYSQYTLEHGGMER